MANYGRTGWEAVALEAIEHIRRDFEEARKKAEEEARENAREEGRDPDGIAEEEIAEFLDIDIDEDEIRRYCEDTREFSIFFSPAEYAQSLNWDDIERENRAWGPGSIASIIADLSLDKATEVVLEMIQDGEIEGLDI